MLSVLLSVALALPAHHPRPVRAVQDASVLVPYRVCPGDTLWSISARFYGDARAWRLIVSDTPRLVVPRRLHAGELLRVRLRG